MLLIKKIDVFAPEPLGVMDVLVSGDKIYRMEPDIDINLCRVIDGQEKKLLPGLIDGHVHVCGGGGEGGYKTRTPELMLSQTVMAGVTTVIGVLGTDGTTRNMANLIAKTKGLRQEGISAYCLTGSYEIPVRTLTGSVTDDIILLEEVIGCGEIAVSDHRASHAPDDALKSVVSAARLGGILSGKAGVVNIHMGDAPEAFQPLMDLLDTSAIPIRQLLPTHINRNPDIFKDGIEFVKRGGCVDFTTSTCKEFIEDGEVPCAEALARVIEATGHANGVTFSSDGQGSMPLFNAAGELTGLTIGTSASLFAAVKECVEAGIGLETAVRAVTCNAADMFKLNKGYLKEGFDADFLIVDGDLNIDSVIAMGKPLMLNKELLVKGTFER